MPFNPTTGVFTRVDNTFSEPVTGTLIDPIDADGLFDDYDSGLTQAYTFTQTGTGAVPVKLAEIFTRPLYTPFMFGALGNGTGDDQTPITNCITAAVAAGASILLTTNTFKCSGTINWAYPGLKVFCVGNTTFIHSGTGIAHNFNGLTHGSPVSGVFAGQFGGPGRIKLKGNPLGGTTYLIYLNNWHAGYMKVEGLDAATILFTEDTGGVGASAVETVFDLVVSTNESVFAVVPDVAINASYLVACIFERPMIEGVGVTSPVVLLANTTLCLFHGGTIEGNAAGGLVLYASSHGNKFDTVDFESNGSTFDMDISGYSNSFDNCSTGATTAGSRIITGTGNNNIFKNCVLQSMNVGVGTSDNTFDNCDFTIAFTNSGTRTNITTPIGLGVLSKVFLDGLTVTNTITGSISGNAATVTTNANLTGDVTSVGNATTLKTAQPAVHTWALAQTFTVAPVFTDQSGSRTALGLGTAATQNTGTSGANVPLLNGANTWGATQAFAAITATTFNKVNIVAPATSAALSLADNSTLTVNASITFATGGSNPTITFPTTAATMARTDAGQTFTGTQVFSSTITGSISGNAGTVTTNANLTGDVTSVGNATTLTNAPVIAKVLTGYTSGAGTVSASDSILSAIQKLNGNDATNANLTGDVTSVGNATTLTNAPVIAKVLTAYSAGAGTVASTDSILQAFQKLGGLVDNAVWSTYTSTFSATSGTATVTARQKTIGKTVFVDIQVAFTSTIVGTFSVTLPATNNATNYSIITGKEISGPGPTGGHAAGGYVAPSSNVLNVLDYAGVQFLTSGSTIVLTGSYEST